MLPFWSPGRLPVAVRSTWGSVDSQTSCTTYATMVKSCSTVTLCILHFAWGSSTFRSKNWRVRGYRHSLISFKHHPLRHCLAKTFSMRVVLCTACPHCIQFGATSTVFKQLCALASMIIQMPTVRYNVVHSRSTRSIGMSVRLFFSSGVEETLPELVQCTFRAHGCYPGRVQSDFSFAAHMDRQRLSTDRSIFRCYVTLCTCVTHQVLRSRSYRRCYRGIKMLQVPSFFMDFGDQWLAISVLKFSAFWPRRFGHNLLKKWDLSGRLSQEIWRCTVARRSGVIKNSLGQFILLRLSNLYLNFEGCTVCLKYLWRIWRIPDFMYVLCIVAGENFRFKSKRLRDCPSNRDPWHFVDDCTVRIDYNLDLRPRSTSNLWATWTFCTWLYCTHRLQPRTTT